MQIGIIGAGFTGLTAALKLQEHGHDVTIYEQEDVPGGLAMGFKKSAWDWSLEKHYHHIFTSDESILGLSKQIGVPFHFSRPNTSSLIDGEILQLDSPLKLLQFAKLTPQERVRMGAVLGYLKYVADWHILESETSHEWLEKMMGDHGYSMIWKPLLIGKFGEYFRDISLAWFWARIKARSTQLGYPEGGFQHFSDILAKKISTQGGTIHYKSTVKKISSDKKIVLEIDSGGKKIEAKFDRVLVTLPNIQFAGIAPSLPADYKKKLRDFQGIGAVNMVLELEEPFLKNDVYWLNICEKDYPFLAVVEHTNFVDRSHYDNKYIVYVGKYLPHGHKYFSLNAQELLREYDPFLKGLKSDYKKSLHDTTIFKVPFAQPIVTKNFSKKILPFTTPLDGVYLANMQQVYPWDRGTNFAVATGAEVAAEMGK